jgi:hypothetical protein
MKEVLLPTAFMLAYCLDYYMTLKMEAIYFSETSVDIERTTWRYIPENTSLYKEVIRGSMKLSIFVVIDLYIF